MFTITFPGGRTQGGDAPTATGQTSRQTDRRLTHTMTIDESETSPLTDEEEPRVSAYVTLVSSDGFHFTVSKDAASISGTLKNMISDTFEEGTTNTIRLHDIDGSVLEKVVEYLYYNEKYKDCVDVPDFHVPTEMALELLVAADFLHV